MRRALSLGLVLLALGCGTGILSAQSGAAIPSSRPANTATPADTASVIPKQISNDSAAALHKSRSDTVLVVKHSFNHKEQIITGSVIMTCLALMMVTMNNYNPR
jgi:hypothetical protein